MDQVTQAVVAELPPAARLRTAIAGVGGGGDRNSDRVG